MATAPACYQHARGHLVSCWLMHTAKHSPCQSPYSCGQAPTPVVCGGEDETAEHQRCGQGLRKSRRQGASQEAFGRREASDSQEGGPGPLAPGQARIVGTRSRPLTPASAGTRVTRRPNGSRVNGKASAGEGISGSASEAARVAAPNIANRSSACRVGGGCFPPTSPVQHVAGVPENYAIDGAGPT